ncbi:MAG: threonylcarbamoyl-AMP synthase [Deltaproteobacteria bacterium CG2_30_63_29]|nr:MAG: threonylcarbamoyl-AMP synthase [Deltaproteobacteria bacterium CG2_30_63_29]PIW01183.1 MAG: threonylcarbamoyl-AMP synthase [Deltaproteobacteria bacterium CG17_big_fil_post_rev_8_21_14_2_50_63_7]PJB37939.1 MAG: threonylcarbamoyl-AMP synthase [Deltaproteobacteria bacterium CG_4_9_14_3_um_filter_63_12]
MIRYSTQHLGEGLFEAATAALHRGELVVVPTETVYGLAADMSNPQAVSAVFEAKGRPKGNPLPLLLPDIATAKSLVTHWSPQIERLCETYWPGPLTIVLPSAAFVSETIRAGGTTIGLRMPAHPVTLELLRRFGRALATPSANLSGEAPPIDAEQALASLSEDSIAVLIDAGPCSLGFSSTVVDLSQDPPKLLRVGAISLADIEQVLAAG